MDTLLREMAEARLRWTSPVVREWYDGHRLLRQLADGLAEDAGRVDDEEFGASFRDHVGIAPETTPAAIASVTLPV